MTGIAHVVARAVADDPHTLGVLALADALDALDDVDAPGPRPATEASGASVFAARGAELVDGVAPVTEFGGARGGPLTVYHQRGAAPALVAGLADSAGRLVVVADEGPLDPLAVLDLRFLARAGAHAVATSDGAASRLDDLGFGSVTRVPPVVAAARLGAVDAYAPTLNHLEVSVPGPLVLSVDDIATPDHAARIVQSFHVLRTYLTRAAQLAIAIPAAPDTSAAAVRTVFREVWGLRLTDAWAQHLVVAGERAALSRVAGVFVTADPAGGDTRYALAAMAEGLPVVAPADGGAAAILGAGALLLPTGAAPTLIAEAVADLLCDESRRAHFAAAAASVVAQYAPDVVAPAWRVALAA